MFADILILLFILPFHQFNIMVGLIGARETMFTGCFLCYMRNLSPVVWTLPLISIVSLSFGVANVLDSFLIVGCTPHVDALIVLRNILSATAFAALFYLNSRWIQFVWTLKDDTRRENESICR